MATKLKVGKLSKGDQAEIRKLLQMGEEVQSIAKILKRSTDAIHKYIERAGLSHGQMKPKDVDKARIKKKLRQSYHWNEFKEQFTHDELIYITEMWADLILQFREDVLSSEEVQIKQLVTTEVLINRTMRIRKECQGEMEKLQKEIDKEKLNKDGGMSSIERIGYLENQLGIVKASLGAHATEFGKLQQTHQAMMKDLKATRDKRIERIEDAKTSFVSYIRMLEDEEVRDRIGDEAELMRMAKDKVEIDLAEYHTFVDDEIDQPFLNADTVKDEE